MAVTPGGGISLGHVVMISLERWDEVWRRNQHMASRLPKLGLADHVTFVNPPERVPLRMADPAAGVSVWTPRRRVPKRLGGLRLVARSVERFARQMGCDTLWVNDANIGAWISGPWRTLYDVTDDWRTAAFTPREVRRLVQAEDRLAKTAVTVVCSEELRERWKTRYGLTAALVPNGVDVEAIRAGAARSLGPGGPHAGYVGTLHDERLDVDLVLETADALVDGMVHLVGPDCLTNMSRSRLLKHPRVKIHGAVGAGEVPSWLVSFDVLICPHRVTSFTLSLDAIKAHEYLATDRPIVATPTSGFQRLLAAGLTVTAERFTAAVLLVAGTKGFRRDVGDWDARAEDMAEAGGAFRSEDRNPAG